MKALLTKDFSLGKLYIIGMSAFYFLFILMFLTYETPEDDALGLAVLFSLPLSSFFGMISTYTLQRDEASGFRNFSSAMPFNRKEIVSEKYLFGLLIVILTLAESFLCFLFGVFRGAWEFADILPFLFLIPAVSMILQSFTLVVSFIFDAKNAGAVLWMLFMLVIFSVNILPDDNQDTVFSLFQKIPLEIVLTAGILLAVLIFAVSWGISIVVYSKKEL